MADRQPRLHLLVEGQTEEVVCRELFEPWLVSQGYSVSLSKLSGVSRWSKIERDISGLLGDSSLTVLTTLIDYYGFPRDAPGMSTRPAGTAYDRVTHVETVLAGHVGDRRFVPNLVLHETEAWVLAAGRQLADLHGDPDLDKRLATFVSDAGGPELVNDGPDSAPSKRLARACVGYVKTFDGPLALADLGLEPLRTSCPHLAVWMVELERRAADVRRPREAAEKHRRLPRVDHARMRQEADDVFGEDRIGGDDLGRR